MSEPTKPEAPATSPAATGSAKILDFPNKPGWWWAWYESAARWYLINISDEDLDEENVPPNYECWTECVPPLPPNTKLRNAGPETQPETKPETGVS